MISRKCYVESLNLKKVRAVCMDVTSLKAKTKPLKESSLEEGLTIPKKEDAKIVEEDILLRDDS